MAPMASDVYVRCLGFTSACPERLRRSQRIAPANRRKRGRMERPYAPAEQARRIERVRVLLNMLDLVYDSVSRNETDPALAGFREPVRRTFACICGGAGCGQCERSAARAAEFGIKLKPGRVLVEERDPYDTGKEGAFDPASRTARERAAVIDAQLERLREAELVRAGVYAERVEYESVLASRRQRRRG